MTADQNLYPTSLNPPFPLVITLIGFVQLGAERSASSSILLFIGVKVIHTPQHHISLTDTAKDLIVKTDGSQKCIR